MPGLRRVLVLAASLAVPRGAMAQEPEPIPFRLAGIDLTLDLDYDRQWLDGRATLSVENWTDAPATEVPILVGRLMRVEAVAGPGGEPLPFDQEITVFGDWTLRQVNAVRASLPAPVPAGDSVRITVRYSGHLVGATETGMRYVRDRIDPAFTVLRSEAYAFPQIGTPSLAAVRSVPRRTFAFAARVTVPDTLVVATGGETTERADANGRATYHVRSRRPVPFLNLTVAPYRVYEDGGVKVYVLPADTAQGGELLATIGRAIEWFRVRYGDLTRAPQFSLMEIPDGWGSQADLDGGIMMEASALREVESRPRLYHEISHFWNAPDEEAPSARWNEGLAVYLQDRVATDLDGADLDEARTAVARSLCRRAGQSEAARTTPLADYGIRHMTDWSYSVGALLFVMLDGVMGTEALDTAYRSLYQETKASAVRLEGLEAAFTGAEPRARAVFGDWVHTTGWYRKLCGDDGAHLDAVVASYR
jgi:aminopeptidase N